MIVYYDESIMTYVSSIRNYFGLSSSYPVNKRFSELLKEKHPQKLFFFLVDGMGANLIKRKLPEDSFLRRNMTYETSTVFPPTTTAATTAILTGKSPNETSWIGWMQYVREIDDIIVPFRGVSYYTNRVYDPELMYQLFPVKPIARELNEKGIPALEIYPSFRPGGCESFHEVCERLEECSHDPDLSFVYAYYDEYDTIMHQYGPSSKEADAYLLHVNEELEKLSESLSEDTLLVVTADHGQIDIEGCHNLYGSEFEKYLRRRPACEQRAMVFYIREGMEKEFERRFKEVYEDEFILLSRKQVLETRIFGEGENHPRFEEMIGDYLAIAKKKSVLNYLEEGIPYTMKGQHAGMHPDELRIPVITYMK